MTPINARPRQSMFAALLTEVVMTTMFLIIIMGSTDKRAAQGVASIVGAVLEAFACRALGESER